MNSFPETIISVTSSGNPVSNNPPPLGFSFSAKMARTNIKNLNDSRTFGLLSLRKVVIDNDQIFESRIPNDIISMIIDYVN